MFYRKIDANSRGSMPEPILDVYPRTYVFCNGFAHSGRAYAPKEWDRFKADLAKLNANHPDHAKYIRFFRGSAQTVKLDSNNRFRFPEGVMKWMGLSDEKREYVVYDAGAFLEFHEAGEWLERLEADAAALEDIAREIHPPHANAGES